MESGERGRKTESGAKSDFSCLLNGLAEPLGKSFLNCKSRSTSLLLAVYIGGEMLNVSREAESHVIWSRRRSRNQLRIISKRCANDLSRRADKYDDLKGRMVICRGLI